MAWTIHKILARWAYAEEAAAYAGFKFTQHLGNHFTYGCVAKRSDPPFHSSFVPEIPEEGDWRAVLEVSKEHGNELSNDLDFSLHELIRQLNTIAESSTSDETGQALTLAGMLSGILQHNAYHSGQIAMARKVILQQRTEREK